AIILRDFPRQQLAIFQLAFLDSDETFCGFLTTPRYKITNCWLTHPTRHRKLLKLARRDPRVVDEKVYQLHIVLGGGMRGRGVWGKPRFALSPFSPSWNFRGISASTR